METKPYDITKVTYKKSICRLKSKVVNSSLDTIVAIPEEKSIHKLLTENLVTKRGAINNFIVAQCLDGHAQSIF